MNNKGGYQIIDFNSHDFKEADEVQIKGIYEKARINKPILAKNIKVEADIFTLFPIRKISTDTVTLFFNISENNIAKIVINNNDTCVYIEVFFNIVNKPSDPE